MRSSLTEKESPLYNATYGKYIILNNKSSILSQINGRKNTVIEIRESIDLKNETLILPEGCILIFHGGGFSNGKLVGRNTLIEAPAYQIFMDNLKISGSFANPIFMADWFKNLQDAVDIASNHGGTVQLSAKAYYLDKTLELNECVSIVGSGNQGAYNYNLGTVLRYKGDSPVVRLNGSGSRPVKNVRLKDLKIWGNGKECSIGSNVGLYIGPKAYYCIFDNVSLYGCSNGVEIDNGWNLRFENVNPYYCNNGYYLNGNNKAPLTTTTFNACVAYNSKIGFNFSHDMNAVTLQSCGTD